MIVTATLDKNLDDEDAKEDKHYDKHMNHNIKEPFVLFSNFVPSTDSK